MSTHQALHVQVTDTNQRQRGALPTNVRKMLAEAGAKHSKIKTATGRSAQTFLMPGRAAAPVHEPAVVPAEPAAERLDGSTRGGVSVRCLTGSLG